MSGLVHGGRLTVVGQTQYLAVVAKSIYFQQVNVDVQAVVLRQWQPRLWLE